MSVLSNKLYLMIGRRHCCTKTERGTEFYDIGIFRKFKRKPNMKQYYKFQGETKTVSQWADKIGISQDTLGARILNGWGIEKALTTPLLKSKNGGSKK